MGRRSKKSASLSQSKRYVANLLARRDYTRHQLRDKLLQRTTPEIADQVLEECAPYLDDRRWADAAVRGALSKGYGPIRIRLKLRQAGVAQELIDELLAPLDEQELLQARYGDWDPADPKIAQKLQRRGFSLSAICSLKDL